MSDNSERSLPPLSSNQETIRPRRPSQEAELARSETLRLMRYYDIQNGDELYRTLLALAKRSPDETTDDWHPIETAPKDGREVLTWRESTVAQCAVAFWFHQDGGGFWVISGGPRLLRVTHWKPLPAGPSKKANGELT